jgi:CheY-like chemotaxis protein
MASAHANTIDAADVNIDVRHAEALLKTGALQRFEGPIHLLLSDVIMPESEGPPLLDRLVIARPAVRVLYMSGYAGEAVRHVLLVEGTPFLQKPFTPQALSQKVREVLDAVNGAPPGLDSRSTARPT